MTHPALTNYKNLILWIFLCGILGGVQAIVFYPIVHICFGWLLVDGVISTLLLAIVSVPLWMIVQFVKTEKNSQFQIIVNTISLCIATLSFWLGIHTGLLYIILSKEIFELIISTLPIRIFIGILAYFVITQKFQIIKTKEEIENEFELPIESEIPIEIPQQTDIIDRVTVKIGQKIHMIASNEILYIQAEGDYVMIFTANGKFLKEQTMKYFESHLPTDFFVRIHRSTIVNVHYISSVQLYEKQNYMIALSNGVKIKASNSGYKLLKQKLHL